MCTLKRFIGGSLFMFVLAGTGLAQEKRARIDTPREPVAAAPLVTAAATAKRVRFVSPGTVVQLRLEVYNEAGQKLFDTELHGGNVLDWPLQDGAGERLQTGSYACVLTTKSLSGRLSQRVGVVIVNDKNASVEAAGAAQLSQLSIAQQQTIGPVEGNTAFTVLQESEAAAITAVTHDGIDGQVARTRGAFSFRLGDFFSGKDTEQMRLTEEGNLGIGTAKPQAKLDVAGMIRAREGFMFSDGSTLKVNEKGVLTRASADGTGPLSVSGTQNRLAKFTDNAGTLGDSVAIDTGTGLQLTAAPSNLVDTNVIFMNGNDRTTGIIASSSSSFTSVNGPYFALRGNTYNAFSGQRGLFAISAGTVSSPTGREGSVIFNTGSDQIRMLIDPSGNVGIGTTGPGAKLDVAGDVNTSTQYNIGGSRVLGISSSAPMFPITNTFAGKGAGQNNTGCCNAFFGANAGESNTSGGGNSFFGADAGISNTVSFNNSFFGNQAGRSNVSGGSNSFFGNQAGQYNTSGNANSFFGNTAGQVSTGDSNSFFGHLAGVHNTTGNSNTFVGVFSGLANTIESNNTLIGDHSDGAIGVTNATAIGFRAKVTQSNSIVLGSINGTNGANSDTNVGIGTTTPTYKLHVVDPSNVGLRVQTDTAGGTVASFAANGDFQIDAPNIGGGRFIVKENGNTGVGTNAPTYKLQVNDASNAGLRVLTNTAGGTVASFGGLGAFVIDTVSTVGGRFTVQQSGMVGIGTNSPDRTLTVNGTADKPGGGSWDTFSDERLKTIKGRFTPGLKALMQLQPLRYEYKPDNALGLTSSGEHIGFGAQAVQKIIPEAVSKNDRGYLLVNNDPILWTMLNAIKEQQHTIEQLRQENKKLNALNAASETRLAAVETTVKRMAQNKRRQHRRK